MASRFGRPPSDLLHLTPGSWDALAVDASVLAAGDIARAEMLPYGIPVNNIGDR